MNKRLNIGIALMMLSFLPTKAQDIFVPYRIGNKFGVGDIHHKIHIKAEYEIVSPIYAHDNYFEAFKNKGKEMLSSLIYRNKILIKDSKYQYYQINEDFIFAAYSDVEKKYLFDIDAYVSRGELYNLQGQRLFKRKRTYISFFNSIEFCKNKPYYVMLIAQKNGKQALILWNRKTQKVEKTLLENIQIISHEPQYRTLQILNLTYSTQDGKIKLGQLKFEATTANLISEKELTITSEKENGVALLESEGKAAVASPPLFPTEKEITLGDNETFYIGTDYPTNIFPRKKESYFKRLAKPRSRNQKVIKQNQKYGIKHIATDTFVVPPIYDSIYVCGSIGFITKNKNKFGLYYGYDNPMLIIEPVYDMLPIIWRMNYAKEGFSLVKLFDEDKQLFCYANQYGELYYKEK